MTAGLAASGAGVLMLTAVHAESPPRVPITSGPIRYGAIEMGDGWAAGLAAEPPRPLQWDGRGP